MIFPVRSKFGVIRVQTKHYEPYMHQDASETFVDGIEFHMLTTIAKKLDMKLKFLDSSLDVESLNYT